MPELITQFHGEYRFLSNFYPAEVLAWGILFPTVEHAYVACKTWDKEVRRQIADIPTPGQAKRFGRSFQAQRLFHEKKYEWMRTLVHRKFLHKHLRELLLNTGEARLVEGNRWHDNYWGACECNACQHHIQQNRLGKILMEVRTNARIN